MLVLKLSTVMPLCGAFRMTLLSIVTVPVTFVITIPSSAAPPAESMTANRVRLGLWVLVRTTPSAVEFWIAPPVQVPADVQAPPLPVMVRPAAVPVAFRTIPLAAPFDEMLRNVSPLPPIFVLVTVSAAPDVVVSVLTIEVLFWVALTVPPPVAVNAALAPVLALIPPVKLIVAPVLLVSENCLSVRYR
jgi:hypothetical protein